MPAEGVADLDRRLADLACRCDDVRDFALDAARVLGRWVPFDGVCVHTLDPATSLPTGEVAASGLPRPRCELGAGDAGAVDGLIRSGRRAACLGHELRAVLARDTMPWGALLLERAAGRRPFSRADADLVASLSHRLAEGLRCALFRAAPLAARSVDDGPPGLALLGPDDSIVTADAAARRWLAELAADRVPPVVAAVARRARSGDPARAYARVRLASSAWVIVRGSPVAGAGEVCTAVTLAPARPHDLAPLIADACELTQRERAVAQLVARGLGTGAIAGRLHVSPWTVQDHLKSIFTKVGVRTRGALVARLFLLHDAPRLS